MGLDWLKEIREDKNFSQEKLATQVGISQQYYNFIEKGKRCKPKKVSVEKRIAKVLGFNWTRFFEDEEETKGISVQVD